MQITNNYFFYRHFVLGDFFVNRKSLFYAQCENLSPTTEKSDTQRIFSVLGETNLQQDP